MSGDVQKTESGPSAEVKRLAVQVAAQLPSNVNEAREVLRLAERIVTDFFGEPMPSL